MREVFDFSNALIRASAVYYVVAKGKTKTPKEQYEYQCNLLAVEMGKYDNMGERKQGMVSGIKKAAKIAGIEYEINQLEPKKYEDPLPAGAKSYLKRLYGELKYGKWSASKEKGNKYTEKGKLAEPDAIELIKFIDSNDYVKNEGVFSNDFICGHPDIIHDREGVNYIVDVKASWDWETFAENIDKPLNPLYYWQLQSYLWLMDGIEGEVSYCLVNTPESILKDECDKLLRRMNVVSELSPEYVESQAKLINNMTFDSIHPLERRLKFQVKRDEVAIDRIKYIVPRCRDYLFELQEMHLTGYFTDKEIPMLEEIEEI